MKKNVNRISSSGISFINYPDNNKPVLCAVDNFPGDNPAYKKRDGFRCNDVSVLDRLSFSQQIDEDFAKIVAGRVKELQVSPPSNLTPEQMLRTLRPSYVQTAAEVSAWEESVYQYMSTTADVSSDDVGKVVNDAVSEVAVEESKSE